MFRSALPTVIALFLLLACGLSTAQAVVDGTPIPCDDRRFDAVGLFMTAYSPTSNCAGYVSGSCVLIAPNKILLCRHQLNVDANQPLPTSTHGFRVRFRRDVSGTAYDSFNGPGGVCHGIYQEFWVTSFTEPYYPGTDLVIGTLDGTPVGITPIGLELDSSPDAGTPIILAGWGYAGECFATGDAWTLRYARGMNPRAIWGNSFAYTACSVNQSGTGGPCLVCPTSGGPYVAANLHDSGAGIFIEVPTHLDKDGRPELRLLGTVDSLVVAVRPTAWNNSRGSPLLAQAGVWNPSLKSDFNRDGTVDMGDLFDYIRAFFGQCCLADANGDGAVTVSDIYAFLQAYFAKG